MTGLFIALLALMSFGLGLIFRSTAGAIAGFVGVTFVFPLVIRGISEHLVRYMPTNILVNSVMSTVRQRRAIPAPVSRRRAAGYGALRHCGRRHRGRAVCQARRLNETGGAMSLKGTRSRYLADVRAVHVSGTSVMCESTSMIG